MKQANRHRDRSYGRPLFQEEIRWSLTLWLFILFLDFSIILAIWAALPGIATWITFLVLTILTALAHQRMALRITVTSGWLLVGTAAIERAFIHEFKALDSGQMKIARGVGTNPLDFLQIRFWIPTGVQISIRDPRDKTPKWIISSKRPGDLVRALSSIEH